MNEKDIPVLIRKGDAEESFKYLYKAYFTKVQRVIMSKNGSVEDAKDVFQDTIVALYRVILEDRYQERLEIGPFIVGVAKKIWFNKIKKDSKLQFKEEMADFDFPVDDSTPFQRKEKEDTINNVLSSIGEQCKELLTHVLFFKMSMKEVAERMHYTNEDSAKTQHYKCRKKLMDKFKDNTQLKEMLSGR